jgi:hypothetical protein
METKSASMVWMQGARHALRQLQDLGLKFFPQISGLEEDYRIMIPSQEIIVSKDLATETVLVTITISDR